MNPTMIVVSVILTVGTLIMLACFLPHILDALDAVWRVIADAARELFPKRSKKVELPPHIADAKGWLRRENKQAMREWDLEFYALCEGSGKSRTMQMAAIQRWLREEAMYYGPCDGQTRLTETERALRQALTHFPRPGKYDVRGGRVLIVRDDGSAALVVDDDKIELGTRPIRSTTTTYYTEEYELGQNKRGINVRPLVEGDYMVHTHGGVAYLYSASGELVRQIPTDYR